MKYIFFILNYEFYETNLLTTFINNVAAKGYIPMRLIGDILICKKGNTNSYYTVKYIEKDINKYTDYVVCRNNVFLITTEDKIDIEKKGKADCKVGLRYILNKGMVYGTISILVLSLNVYDLVMRIYTFDKLYATILGSVFLAAFLLYYTADMLEYSSSSAFQETMQKYNERSRTKRILFRAGDAVKFFAYFGGIIIGLIAALVNSLDNLLLLIFLWLILFICAYFYKARLRNSFLYLPSLASMCYLFSLIIF